MDVLCSDKTGTLTLNRLTVNAELITSMGLSYDEDDGGNGGGVGGVEGGVGGGGDNKEGGGGGREGEEACAPPPPPPVVVVTVEAANRLLLAGARASRVNNPDAIDAAVVSALKGRGLPLTPVPWIEELRFMPFDPVGKRTQITYRIPRSSDDDGDGAAADVVQITKGAPPVIVNLCLPPGLLGSDEKKEGLRARVENDIDALARRGYRALGVAQRHSLRPPGAQAPEDDATTEWSEWRLTGLLPVYDPPRHDTAATIAAAASMGVGVKMITGDAVAIGRETARLLGMGTDFVEPAQLFADHDKNRGGGGGKGDGAVAADDDDEEEEEEEGDRVSAEVVSRADGFAGVFPEHKYAIVQALKAMGHTVGMTGDGVNDAPALKVAHVVGRGAS